MDTADVKTKILQFTQESEPADNQTPFEQKLRAVLKKAIAEYRKGLDRTRDEKEEPAGGTIDINELIFQMSKDLGKIELQLSQCMHKLEEVTEQIDRLSASQTSDSAI